MRIICNFIPLKVFFHFVSILLFSSIALPLQSQVGLFLGAGTSYVTHDQKIQGAQNSFHPYVGASVELPPFQNNSRFSLRESFVFNFKGYKQESLGLTYVNRFLYSSIQSQILCELWPYLGVFAGMEVSFLIPNENQRDLDYRKIDLGWQVGIDLFKRNLFGAMLSYTHGLLPQLEYYDFDEFGNFNGRRKGIFHHAFVISVHYKIYEDEISI